MKTVYLDNAASTRVDPKVMEAMLPYFEENYSNPSSVHAMGRRAKEAVEEAKKHIAATSGASSEEVILTSGGTESNNLAILGTARRGEGKHVVTSAIEHPSVQNCCQYLGRSGYEVSVVGVDDHGIIDLAEFEDSLRDDTVIVSVMSANNEVGTIQPVKEMVKMAHERGIPFHTDAVQAVGQMELCEEVDMLSISGHKIYGPKGTGALLVRGDIDIEPIIHGGGQQDGLRAGTEDVPGFVGLGEACRSLNNQSRGYIPKIRSLRDSTIEHIMDEIPDTRSNGHPKKRLPNNINISFQGINSSYLVRKLSERGIYVSSGSACDSGGSPSKTLLAMGLSHDIANSALRITLSKWNSEEDIEILMDHLPEIVKNGRLFGEATHV